LLLNFICASFLISALGERKKINEFFYKLKLTFIYKLKIKNKRLQINSCIDFKFICPSYFYHIISNGEVHSKISLESLQKLINF